MLEVLPTTSEAGKFHSYCVFHQVQIWKGSTDILPELWEWKVVENMFPIAMVEAPASDNLLKIIRCASKRDCITTRCTCFKHGLKCTEICVECRGVSCLNAQEKILDHDDEE